MNKTEYVLHEDYTDLQSEVYGILWGFRFEAPHDELLGLLYNIDNDQEKVIKELCDMLNVLQTIETTEKIKEVLIDFFNENLNIKKNECKRDWKTSQ